MSSGSAGWAGTSDVRGAAPAYPQNQNALQRVALFAALALIFLRCSSIHELLTYTLNFRPYLVAALTLLATILTVLAGGLGRTFNRRPPLYWLCVLTWLVFAAALSTWKSGSARVIFNYARLEWILLPVIAGTVCTWSEFVNMARVLALAAVATEVICFAFSGTGRLALQFGIMANANDIAAHLIFLLPFVLYFFLTAQGRPVRRLLTMAVLGAGMYLVFATASRGALVAISVMFLFWLWQGSFKERLAIMGAALVLTAGLAVSLQSTAITRYSSLFRDDTREVDEAVASGTARKRLLLASLRLTAENPLFGVGPGQFAEVNGMTLRNAGIRAMWQVTHNTYTQFSSEAGIPATLLILAALVSTYRLLNRTRKTARGANAAHIRTAALCTSLSLIGFSTAAMFLSLAYRFYLPALGGLAIALSAAASAEE